ncbi:MAG: hypothetical protein AAF845_05600 [Bacteroidota bacterium]
MPTPDNADVSRRDYFFPVLPAPLRSLLDAKAKRGEEFSEDEAVLDVMLALDRNDLRPHRYLAKRWGWSASRAYRVLDALRTEAARWRRFGADVKHSETEVKHSETENAHIVAVKGTSETQVKHSETEAKQYRTDSDTRTQKKQNPPIVPPGGAGGGVETGKDATGNGVPGGAGRADRFAEWWSVYPSGHKVKKKDALKKWRARKLDRIADTLIADVQRRVAEDDKWKRGFVPNPTTYLNGDRWEDDIARPKRGDSAVTTSADFLPDFADMD